MTLTVDTFFTALPLKEGVYLIVVILLLIVGFEVSVVAMLNEIPSSVLGYGINGPDERIALITDVVFNATVAGCLLYAVPFSDSGFIGIPGVWLFVVNIVNFVVYAFKGLAEIALLPVFISLLSALKVYFAIVIWSYANFVALLELQERNANENVVDNVESGEVRVPNVKSDEVKVRKVESKEVKVRKVESEEVEVRKKRHRKDRRDRRAVEDNLSAASSKTFAENSVESEEVVERIVESEDTEVRKKRPRKERRDRKAVDDNLSSTSSKTTFVKTMR